MDEQISLFLEANIHGLANNPILFMENHLFVQHRAALARFKLNQTQKNIVSKLQNNSIIVDQIIERQVGVTSVLCAYALWLTLFNLGQVTTIHGKTNVMVSHNRGVFRYMYDWLTPSLKVDLTVYNKTFVELETKSKVKFLNQNPNGVRGCTVNCAILDTSDLYSPQMRDDLIQTLRVQGCDELVVLDDSLVA